MARGPWVVKLKANSWSEDSKVRALKQMTLEMKEAVLKHKGPLGRK